MFKSLIVTLLVAILLPFLFFPHSPSYAQDSDCDAELLADTEAHSFAMYLFSEIERPIFDRQSYVIAILVYANKLTIEDDVCGLGVQAKLLSWTFEVYRAKANHHFKLINDEEYKQVEAALFSQRDRLYPMYCEAFPIACVDGVPMSYDDFVESIEPELTSS